MTTTNPKLNSILSKLLNAEREDLILSLLVRNAISIEFNKMAKENVSEGIEFHDQIIQFLSVNRPELISQTFEFSIPIAFWENINDEPIQETIYEIRK